MENAFRLSVRELVAFCFPPEDITPGGGMEDMLAGSRAHRARQAAQEGQTERPVKHCFELENERLELFGRIDAFTDGDIPLVEEMKLGIPDGDAPWLAHRAQAVCYGAMTAAESGCRRVRLRISYLDAGGGVQHSFEEEQTAESLMAETEEWLAQYLVFALRERAHRLRRDMSIRALGFPYEDYRAGQRELAVQVYTAISRKKRLFASLPTGTGKSAAVLYPALKAMGEGKTGKILYLTARNTARQSPLMALERMRGQGLHARISVLTAKEKLCPHMTRCHPDDCPRAKGHYIRQEDGVSELLESDAPVWTDELIMTIAEKHCACPFELALRLCQLADVVLMDLNYAFDPFAQVKRLFQRERRMTLLVDEAHHAVDRVRESLSGELDSGILRPFRSSFGKLAGRKHPYYAALTGLIHRLQALELPPDATMEESGREARLDAVPPSVTEAVEQVMEQAGALLGTPRNVNLSEIFAVVRLMLPFLYAAEHFDEDYAALIHAHGKERGLTLYCLLPGKEIARVSKGMSGAVFFSATLSPLGAMRRLLGGAEDDACFSLPSPFPRENLRVLRQRVPTTYAARERTADMVAQVISKTVNVKRGNYIVYFPSYAYMELIRSRLDESALPPLWVQQRDMAEESRADFFQAFSGEARLGLCVLGGLFSEGVDLPGERLIGAIIVGVGLPTPSQKLRAIQSCYEAHFGDGYAYACRIPAMQKVLQAGGRVIRSDTDRGLIVLVDSRYYERDYTTLLPEEWTTEGGDVERAAKELWQ